MRTSSIRALARFGYGGHPSQVTVRDPRAWALAQLEGTPPERAVPSGASTREVQATLKLYRDAAAERDPDRRRETVAEARRALVGIVASESISALTARITSERPFVERLVDFWSNHLCISVPSKLLVGPFAGDYERQAIRPFVLGRFEEMVLASARHPAMLVYLDNAQSVGPSSQFAKRAARGAQRNTARGLNENYARELLELHTLGVDGGYSQNDVTELARLLTGWSIAGQDGRAPVRFLFAAGRHEPGRKTILGERYGDGEREGERAIRALCRHPATARFVATKLAIHFVADVPPQSSIDRLAKVFRESDGDLRAVSRELVALPEAWDESNRKFRPPQDWLVAVLRALDAPGANLQLLNILRQLRHSPWSPSSPKGFGDLERDWADADALLNRAEFARTLARRPLGRAIDPRTLGAIVGADSSGTPLGAMLGDASIGRADRVAIALASPSFQWR